MMCCFGWSTWRKSSLLTGKVKSILIGSLDNCGYFSLILHQNLTSDSCLKVSCSLNSKTISMNFSYSDTWKSIGISCTFQKKNHMLIWLWISSEKYFTYWEAVKFTEVNTSFPKFLFLLKSSNFIFGNKYCQLFFLIWQADSLYSFQCVL